MMVGLVKNPKNMRQPYILGCSDNTEQTTVKTNQSMTSNRNLHFPTRTFLCSFNLCQSKT